MKKFLGAFIILALLALSAVSLAAPASRVAPERPPASSRMPEIRSGQQAARTQPIIIDHTCTDLSKIPDYWIGKAKEQLRLAYGHTSHGSQPISGMQVLMDSSLNGHHLYDFNSDGALENGVLSLHDYTPSGDLGHNGDLTWADSTRDYLNSAQGTGPSRNVVLWSWCGGVSDNTQEGIAAYLGAMNQLEVDYPNITFIYMTGHLDGSGVDGNLNVRNNQIREYVRANNKVLFDFADIESYNPDGDEFMSKLALDSCVYDGNGNGNPWDDETNWAVEWCAAHSGDPLCSACDCAHSEALNCNLKARAFWWMLARLAGWNGLPEGASYKAASNGTPVLGEVVTYTIVVQGLTAPLTATVYLTDTVPEGLAYVPGTLTATAGDVNDANAPILQWSGILSPTPAITLTYAATVTAVDEQSITNNAVIAAPGYETITRSATIVANVSAAQPDLSSSTKQADRPAAVTGETVTYTLRLINSGGPLSAMLYLTDTVPEGLAFIPGTLAASSGDVDDSNAPVLRWSGVLTPTPAVTITYAVSVVYGLGSTSIPPAVITNTAFAAAPGVVSIVLSEAITVGGPVSQEYVYLPLVMRGAGAPGLGAR